MPLARAAAWLLGLAAAALTYLAYAPSLGGALVFDDAAHIPPLWPLVKDGSVLGLWEAVWSSGAGPSRRPLAMLTLALQVQWSGPRILPLELGNLAIHLAVGAVLFLIARTLLCTAPSLHLSERRAAALAGAAAVLWLVHPLNLTSVAYIVQRMNSLSALFTTLAIWAWLRMRTADPASRRPLRSAVWVAVLGLAGFFSKENALLLPLFILVIEAALYDDLPAAFRRRVSASWARAALIAAGVTVAVALLTWRTIGGYGNRPFELGERLLTETGVLLWYIKSLFLPDLNELSLLHDDWPVWDSLADPAVALAAAALAGLVGAAVWARSRLPVLTFGILWFLAGHLLESSFFALDLVYEHRNYLPGFGLLLAAVTLAERTLRRIPVGHIAAPAAALLLAVAFTAQTHQRAERWGDDSRARLAHLLSRDGSMQASIMAAGHLAAMAGRAEAPAERTRLLGRAEAQFRHALDVAPAGSPAPLFGWVRMRSRHGLGPDPELRHRLKTRLASGSIDDATVNGIHALTTCAASGPCTDLRAEVRDLLQALLARTDLRDKERSRALRDLAHYTLEVDEAPGRAVRLVREAAQLVPRDLDVRMELAYHLARAGRDRAALAELDRIQREDTLGRKVYTRRQLAFAIRTGRV